MRISCNGCRVLRKGCSDDCSIRPCLDWIKTPDSQANATVFLAKFYGRAGLMNLINAAPPPLRPAVFRSLLYEACGRIVNPIHGSVGLMWSGSWQLCHGAVEAVLRGAPVAQMAVDAAEAKMSPPFKAYDIRHVNKEGKCSGSAELNRVRSRCRFKRSGLKSKRVRASAGSADESSLSHQSHEAAAEPACVERESESMGSAGSAEPDNGAEPVLESKSEDDRRASGEGEIDLELTLGFEPLSRCVKIRDTAAERGSGSAAGLCKVELRLDCPAFVTDSSS